MAKEAVRAKYVINCAGGFSDKISAMIGDDSFKIKPRLGEYVLLKKTQVLHYLELLLIALEPRVE